MIFLRIANEKITNTYHFIYKPQLERDHSLYKSGKIGRNGYISISNNLNICLKI